MTDKQAGHATADLERELDRVIAAGDFTTHFQPLVDMRSARIFGYEALTRGPSDSPLHSPLVLFDVAARLGRLVELERIVIRLILDRFQTQDLPGKLFLNVSADTLMALHGCIDVLQQELAELALPASRIVVELTETRPVIDAAMLRNAVESLRSIGLVMALDDLGEGFSSLRRWAEMRPEFVKLDRHFVDGLHADPLKQQFVRSVLEMASSSGAILIAEGLEEESDLRILQQIGVPICQGYLLGKPVALPRTSLRPDIGAMLGAHTGLKPREHAMRELYGKPTTAGQLAQAGKTLTAATTCNQVVEMFSSQPNLMSMPVLDDEARPIGLLRAMEVLQHGSERYFLDVFGRRSCTMVMDRHPLVFDFATTLRTMSEAISNVEDKQLVDGFIVTREGLYFGIGRVADLLRAISDLQVFSARYANPLTLLPGNVPIDTQIENLIGQSVPFVAVHWDLDNFKPFNDLYGYRAGDEIIQLTARILHQTCDGEIDFLGHVGGDDFVTLFCSEDWEARVQQAISQFDSAVLGHFTAEHVAARGFETLNRQGENVFHPLTSISAGVVKVEPGIYEAAAQVSRAIGSAKKQAKRIDGSAYFVERRRPEHALALH